MYELFAVNYNTRSEVKHVERMASLQATDIRSLRIERGISQGDLARMANVPPSELSKCERGLVPPDPNVIESISSVLSVSPDALFRTHRTMFDHPVSGEGYVTSKKNTFFAVKREKAPDRDKVPVLDIFCGTGGFSSGFEQTGKFQVIGGLDFMPDRIDTFSFNHPAAKAYCYDITKFPLSEFERDIVPQVIIGGPPCQGFTSIRPFRSVNENDPRNNLFVHFALAVKRMRPKWFVLENVVGLSTHQGGKTLTRLCSIFEGLGYAVSWSVLNAVHFGLPQRRERLVMVGSSEGQTFEFPKPTHYFAGRSMAKNSTSCSGIAKRRLKPVVTVMDAIGDLPKVDAGRTATGCGRATTPYQRMMRRGNAAELGLHSATAHSERMLEIIRHSGPNRSSIPKGMVTTGFSTSYSRLDPDEPSVTITSNFGFAGSNKCIHPYQDRALTPREAARLQGFDDGYKFIGNRTKILKQIGNAVPPILGRVIGDAVFRQTRL